MNRFNRFLFVCTLIVTLAPARVFTQGVTTPPSGGNQKSTVIQHMGLAKVKIIYNSPDVAGREGQIWGNLVPYGTTDFKAQGFGTSTEGPWRAGANENTIIYFSHDTKVEGTLVKAGAYGLHFIPKENEPWTLILSKNTSQWGSYFYEPSEDALRVEVSPKEATFREYLTYDFIEKGFDKSVVALLWENLQLPISLEVPGMTELYVDNMKKELQSTAGFTYMGYLSAVNFCLSNNTHLEDALAWANMAVDAPFIGQKNFNTLQAKSNVLAALNKTEKAKATMKDALDLGTPMQVYQYGASLAQKEKKEEATEVFQFAAEKFPDTWLSHAGMGAAYRINGEKKKALKHYEAALEDAPDQWKQAIKARMESMEK